jgi:GDPmannose 4,6-dehydratase
VSGARALVTGITGQDGSYLADLLLAKGYDVHGMVRPGTEFDAPSAHLAGHVTRHEGDLADPDSLAAVLNAARPAELYHLAAPTFVPASWDDMAGTMVAIAGGTAALLQAARALDSAMRVYVASSSAIFGDAGESPQEESSPMRPRDPYAVAKLAAHALVGVMRDRYGMHASSGITYNHESPRRPEQFLPRRVTRAAAAIKLGVTDELVLGDLDAVRDWSHASDVVRAAWLMVQQDQPDDYAIASGVGRTVRDLVAAAFEHVGLRPDEYVRVDPELVRSREDSPLVGNSVKARQVLGWKPEIPFEAMIAEMVEADLALLSGDQPGVRARAASGPSAS